MVWAYEKDGVNDISPLERYKPIPAGFIITLLKSFPIAPTAPAIAWLRAEP